MLSKDCNHSACLRCTFANQLIAKTDIINDKIEPSVMPCTYFKCKKKIQFSVETLSALKEYLDKNRSHIPEDYQKSDRAISNFDKSKNAAIVSINKEEDTVDQYSKSNFTKKPIKDFSICDEIEESMKEINFEKKVGSVIKNIENNFKKDKKPYANNLLLSENMGSIIEMDTKDQSVLDETELNMLFVNNSEMQMIEKSKVKYGSIIDKEYLCNTNNESMINDSVICRSIVMTNRDLPNDLEFSAIKSISNLDSLLEDKDPYDEITMLDKTIKFDDCDLKGIYNDYNSDVSQSYISKHDLNSSLRNDSKFNYGSGLCDNFRNYNEKKNFDLLKDAGLSPIDYDTLSKKTINEELTRLNEKNNKIKDNFEQNQQKSLSSRNMESDTIKESECFKKNQYYSNNKNFTAMQSNKNIDPTTKKIHEENISFESLKNNNNQEHVLNIEIKERQSKDIPDVPAKSDSKIKKSENIEMGDCNETNHTTQEQEFVTPRKKVTGNVISKDNANVENLMSINNQLELTPISKPNTSEIEMKNKYNITEKTKRNNLYISVQKSIINYSHENQKENKSNAKSKKLTDLAEKEIKHLSTQAQKLTNLIEENDKKKALHIESLEILTQKILFFWNKEKLLINQKFNEGFRSVANDLTQKMSGQQNKLIKVTSLKSSIDIMVTQERNIDKNILNKDMIKFEESLMKNIQDNEDLNLSISAQEKFFSKHIESAKKTVNYYQLYFENFMGVSFNDEFDKFRLQNLNSNRSVETNFSKQNNSNLNNTNVYSNLEKDQDFESYKDCYKNLTKKGSNYNELSTKDNLSLKKDSSLNSKPSQKSITLNTSQILDNNSINVYRKNSANVFDTTDFSNKSNNSKQPFNSKPNKGPKTQDTTINGTNNKVNIYIKDDSTKLSELKIERFSPTKENFKKLIKDLKNENHSLNVSSLIKKQTNASYMTRELRKSATMSFEENKQKDKNPLRLISSDYLEAQNDLKPQKNNAKSFKNYYGITDEISYNKKHDLQPQYSYTYDNRNFESINIESKKIEGNGKIERMSEALYDLKTKFNVQEMESKNKFDQSGQNYKNQSSGYDEKMTKYYASYKYNSIEKYSSKEKEDANNKKGDSKDLVEPFNSELNSDQQFFSNKTPDNFQESNNLSKKSDENSQTNKNMGKKAKQKNNKEQGGGVFTEFYRIKSKIDRTINKYMQITDSNDAVKNKEEKNSKKDKTMLLVDFSNRNSQTDKTPKIIHNHKTM